MKRLPFSQVEIDQTYRLHPDDEVFIKKDEQFGVALKDSFKEWVNPAEWVYVLEDTDPTD